MNQFEACIELYKKWNQKINVVSRTDIDNLEERHIKHSLAIAKFITFQPGTDILDLGTGGGFPGIPLAITFPEVKFVLVDSIGKKIKVVNEVVAGLGLKNVETIHGRAEDVKQKFDFVVTRAVAPMENLERWTHGKFKKKNLNAIPNGIIALKGGDLTEELKPYRKLAIIEDISQWYKEEFFENKKLVYLPM